MKIKILFIASIILMANSSFGLKAQNLETVKFITSGNCYTCELRIEGAVKELPGIDSVRWDYDAKVTTVRYDNTKVDIYTIMKKIASVGHDTEWYQGDGFYYLQHLIGTCCEYPRTLTYDNVQIGYLSLMNKWVSVNDKSNQDISIYQTNDGNTLAYNISGYDNTALDMCIYALNGVEVFTKSNIISSGEVDLTYLNTGAYIVRMTNKNQSIFQQKIIKR